MADHGAAFGLGFARPPGLAGVRARGDGRRMLSLALTDAGPTSAGRDPVIGRGGSVVVRHGGGGWTIEADGYASVAVEEGGARMTCTPAPDAPPHRWQALVAGQGLPLAATLQGLEVLHAAAVVVGGRALVVIAGPGHGKSTTLAALLRTGALPLADDALAVELREGTLLAHPSLAVAGMRADGLALIGAEPREFGEVLGEVEGSARVVLPALAAAAPVTTAVVLDASPGARDGQEVDARELLGASFAPYVRGPERLARHLDVTAAFARTVRVARIAVGPGIGPDVVARRALELHGAP